LQGKARAVNSPPKSGSGLPAEDIAILRGFYEAMCFSEPEARTVFAAMIGDLRRQSFAAIREAPSEKAAGVAATLESEGVVDFGVLVDAPKAAAMLAHFRPAPLYAAHSIEHSDGVPRAFEDVRRDFHYGCYARGHVLGCPHLIEIANDPHLLQIAETYLGCPPTIYNVNAWWSFAQSQTAARYSQSLHRDIEELRFLTLFIYLTPVNDRNGPHRYIKHSHNKAALTQALGKIGLRQEAIGPLIDPLFVGNGYDYSDKSDALLGHLAMVWKGPPGSAILADTYGLHMGIPPAEGERLMVWVRYGLGPNCSSFGGGSGTYSELVRSRIPQTERARYINRLLLTE